MGVLLIIGCSDPQCILSSFEKNKCLSTNKKVCSYFFFKVGSGELEGVEEGVGGRQPDVVARLVPFHAVNDRSQDLVRLLLQAPVVLNKNITR